MRIDDVIHSPSYQRDLSRRAAERHVLRVALQEARSRRPAHVGPLYRLRHSLAVGLVATARLIDAT